MLTTQQKAKYKKEIQKNKHEIFVISFDEMDAIIRSYTHKLKVDAQERWAKLKKQANFAANYYSTSEDLMTIEKLVSELGGFGARAYIRTYGGKAHIILKGYPGLRKILTGTKYGIKNPKIITMGLGKAGAIHALKDGGLLTIALLTIYRITDFVLTDKETLTQLVGTLATDVVKVGITTGASIAVAALVSASTLAIGPMVAVVVVTIGVSYGLDYLDEKFHITDRVVAGLDELSDKSQSIIANTKRELHNLIVDTENSVFDYVVGSAERIAIRWVNHQLERYFSLSPSIY